MTGIERIAAERKRHEEKGYTAEFDDQWEFGQLAEAAATYASRPYRDGAIVNWRRLHWPWDFWTFNPEEDRIRELVKAGSLIAAEIDRLLRIDKTTEEK
jgi:hypothetical protein